MRFISLKILILFVISADILFGQEVIPTSDKTADSLFQVISVTKNNSDKLKNIELFCADYRYVYPENCLKQIDQYFAEAKNAITKENVNLIRYKGDIYWHLGDLPQSIKQYAITLEFHKKNNNKKGVSQALGDIGYLEMEQGKYPEALAHYKEALKLSKENKDDEYIGIIGIYIAQLYDWMGDYKESLKMYHEMRLHFQNDKSLRRPGITLMNIGAIHGNNKVIDSALFYYNRCLEVLPLSEEKTRVIAKINIAYNLLLLHKDLTRARALLDEGRKVFEKYNSQSNIALVDYYDGLYFIEVVNYAMAKKNLIKAIEHYKKENSVSRLAMLYDRLSFVYEKQHKLDSAYAIYKLFKQCNDSVLIDLSQKNMSYQKILFETDKKQLAIDALEQKQIVQKEQLEKERMQRFVLYGGLALLFVFGTFMYNRFKVTTRQKKVIELQKKEVEIQKSNAEYQQHLVEEKNKEITDSINYAKRIQAAILPSARFLNKHLNDYFVLYKPKDIVAGDFYWLQVIDEEEQNNKEHFVLPSLNQIKSKIVLFAAADCTGHGVPGALVSVICNNGLERSVREHYLCDPGKILTKTREIIIKEFEKSDEDVKDGMDISLCAIQNNILYWSGANNPLWFIRNNELIEYKANKQPIGKYADHKPFDTHVIALEKGDVFYVFTDGYADQFGGPKGKKFKYKKLEELLLSISHLPMDIQSERLELEFINWRGELEQVDDVCIVGFRV